MEKERIKQILNNILYGIVGFMSICFTIGVIIHLLSALLC
jgi:hypothetical protein